MHTFSQKQKSTLEVNSASPARLDRAFFGQSPDGRSILHLQRMIGNHAVQRLGQDNAGGLNADSGGSTPTHFTHDFSRIPLHPEAHIMNLSELTISAPEDLCEQEADRVAEMVMRMPKPDLTLGGSDSERSDSARIKRECSECGEKKLSQLDEKEDENEMIASKSRAPSVNSKPVASGLHGAFGTGESDGHGLPASVRGFFETRFGHDFAQVRVHADNRAAEMARGFNARAFTMGNDIYFGSGEYAPGTSTGDKLLAHELTHTIQQSRVGSHFVGRARSGTAAVRLSSAPPSIQRKEAVLKPEVTPGNPLERTLAGEPPGLTTPFVNGVEISSKGKLLEAMPVVKAFSVGSAPDTCKVSTPIDINSKAKIITASDPGKNGWTATASFATLKNVFKVMDKACEAKKGNIDVRLAAAMGNKAFAEKVRQAEGDHEKVIAENHNTYLKPYHDLVNSKEGSDKDRKKCAVDLAIDLSAKRNEAATNWMKSWNASVDKLDAPDGPHRPELSVKVVGKCDEVLGTVKGAGK